MSGLFIAIDAVVMFLGIMCGFWICELIDILVAVAIAPLFGFRLSSINVFGTLFARHCDNKWVKSRGKFSLYLTHRCMPKDLTVSVPRKTEIIFMILRSLVFVLTACVITALFFQNIAKAVLSVFFSTYLPDTFFLGLSFGAVMSAMIFIVFFIRSCGKSGLSEHIRSIIELIRAGVPFAEFNMKPLGELPYKTDKNSERDIYNCFYLMYLISAGQYGELWMPAHELTDHILQDRSNTGNSITVLYILIFYYSRYELNPELAKKFLDRAGTTIAADTDANAKRVLAYYAYCVEGDRQKARFFTDQALACVDIFSVGSERELERRLIQELDDTLKTEGY